jgi:hypothetical protein
MRCARRCHSCSVVDHWVCPISPCQRVVTTTNPITVAATCYGHHCHLRTVQGSVISLHLCRNDLHPLLSPLPRSRYFALSPSPSLHPHTRTYSTPCANTIHTAHSVPIYTTLLTHDHDIHTPSLSIYTRHHRHIPPHTGTPHHTHCVLITITTSHRAQAHDDQRGHLWAGVPRSCQRYRRHDEHSLCRDGPSRLWLVQVIRLLCS